MNHKMMDRKKNSTPIEGEQQIDGAAKRLNEQVLWENTVSGKYSETEKSAPNQKADEAGTD